MNIYKNKRGVTLIEIIIASVVVGIIMLGVVATNITLQKNVRGSSDSYFVVQNTTNSLNRILADAALIIGYPSSPGFAIDKTAPLPAGWTATLATVNGSSATIPEAANNTFCFNQAAVPPSPPDPLLATWKCYTFVSSNIYSCGPQVYTAACAASANNLIGTASALTPTFTINSAANSAQQVLFQVSIVNCLTPTNGCAPGNSSDPYVIKQGSVSPPGHGAA